MKHKHAAALAIWRNRASRSASDRAYFAYTLLLGMLIVAAPVARVTWMFLTRPDISAALVSPTAAGSASLLVCGFWVMALLAGRRRGPIVFPPFLVYALTESELPRFVAFRRRTAAATISIATLTGIVAAVIAASLASAGLVEIEAVLVFGVSGMLVGILATTCWLIGQAHPRVAGAVALIMPALAGASFLAPFLRPVLPWSWAMSAYPGSCSLLGFGLLLAVTVGGVAIVPRTLNRLDGDALAAQASLWDTAVAHAISLDVGSVSTTYQARPTIGRRIDAVPGSKSSPRVFLVRDLIGAVRTPARLVSGVVALIAAGALLVAAVSLPGPSILLGTASGVLAYIGFGSVADGIAHAAQVASDQPLYGLSDSRVLALHCLLPLGVGVVATTGGAVAFTLATALGDLHVFLCLVPLVSVIVLGAKISDALRGTEPLFLLTPAPSPMGDPMPLIRVLWALDGPLLAALVGMAAAVVGAAAYPLVAVAFLVATICVVRWLRRD